MALSQFCLWNSNCFQKCHNHRCLSCSNYLNLLSELSEIPLLNLSEGAFSEWISIGNWLILSSDLIVPLCFKSYLWVLLINSLIHLANRWSVQHYLWKSFIWMLLYLHRKPQQIYIETRALTANGLLKT